MKRASVAAAAGLMMLAGLMPGQMRRPGEAAIFLKNGERIIDRIVDIVGERLVLKTEAHGEFPLRDLWLLNFVDGGWNFPAERNLLETNEHYVFKKNGDVFSGRIVDFFGDPGLFEFETGETFPLGEVRRIYFSRTVPRGLR